MSHKVTLSVRIGFQPDLVLSSCHTEHDPPSQCRFGVVNLTASSFLLPLVALSELSGPKRLQYMST